jgi:adenylate cyclase
VERKLVAILAADVVGYSRLMAADEAGTLARLQALRRDRIDPLLTHHGGRLVKLMGDGALVEFASVSEAIDCAAAIQRTADEANAASPKAAPILFRIGVNLGEIIVEGDDIYGDGVNVAARLERIAPPGGIAVSGEAYDQSRGRTSVAFRSAGRQRLKNIPRPIRVYVTHSDTNSARSLLRPGRRAFHAAAALVLMLAGGWGAWIALRPAAPPDAPRLATDQDNRPSIMVLPFANMSGDPAQAYFADGITDSIITDLSRVSGLFVIARNTSFTFRDQDLDLGAVSKEFGIRYVLEGSVQKSGQHVRVNANLIDVHSGYQLWASRLDRDSTDIFALQDEMTGRVIDALKVELTQAERHAVQASFTDNPEAYDLYLRAWAQYWQYNEPARAEARRLLNQALALDPNFARAVALLAVTYTSQSGASLADPEHDLDQAYQIARRAVALDPDLPQVHWVLALVHMFRREYDEAEASARRAIELDPNYADAYALLAWILQYAGEPESALSEIAKAIRLNPRPPFPYFSSEAEAYFSIGNYQTAAGISAQALERNPSGQRLRLFMAASLVHLGQVEDARWEVQEILVLEPGLTLAKLPGIAPYKDPKVLDSLVSALRTAGLPE